MMKIRRTVWGIIAVAAAAGACNDPGDATQEAPPSVLATEDGVQEADGAPRPGADGIVRTGEVTVGGVPVTVEIADTPGLRQRGLMERDSLPEDHGMLFVYSEAQERSFWMRNTPLALDIAFIDGNGTIINIETMQPNSDSTTMSAAPMTYALEMEAGWFEANGVQPGARVQF